MQVDGFHRALTASVLERIASTGLGVAPSPSPRLR